MADTAVAEYGGIDILVNNAAIGGGGRLMELSEAEWDRIIAINLKSVFLCTQAVVPHMHTRGRGAIVNISSVLGFTAFPGTVAYSTAKAGILGFTRAVALDLARWNIRVNAIAPGSIDTPMMWEGVTEAEMPRVAREVAEAEPVGRVGDPWEIARAALFLASDESSFVVGTPLIVDGGLLAKCPAPR
jgi:NAD(P)-dependent dehydrogenase (short-subunit alcohol dehydrogenase family)